MKHPERRLLSIILLFLYSCFFSLLAVGQSFSATTEKLYESTIKVTDNKSEKELIAEAFAHVLIKVTGHSDITTSTAYQALLTKAQDAISQFRYDYKLPENSADEASDNASENPSDKSKEPAKEKWFWVRFNPGIIDSMLKQAQLPIWGKVRPDTLIWLAQDIGGQRILQSHYDQPEIYRAIKQQADYRGIPLTFPFLDLQDQNNISATDIWGNFNDAILLASRRYQTQATLTIRLEQNKSGLWNSQWNLLMLGKVQSWQLQDKDQQHLVAAGIDELADRLARQFAQVSTGGMGDNDLLVQINNVSNFQEFQELDDYLRNLATVKALALVLTQQDRVLYKISYRGDKNALLQEIRLGDMLNSVERSRDDYTANDESREFKPVILDDVKHPQQEPAMSEREKALNAMNIGKHKAQSQPGKTDNITAVANPPAANTINTLIPDLEYWLAR